MRNSQAASKVLYYILPACMLTCFLSCRGDRAQNYKESTNIPEVKEIKESKAGIFLTYLDALVKLPDATFNKAGIKSVNQKYVSELPLVMHDSIKEENKQDISMQYYKNNQTSPEVESAMVILIPKNITDSLAVLDFTYHFGPITDEKPLIGITEQPRPVHIKVASDREIKLTFRNKINRDQAGVTMVEILNYR